MTSHVYLLVTLAAVIQDPMQCYILQISNITHVLGTLGLECSPVFWGRSSVELSTFCGIAGTCRAIVKRWAWRPYWCVCPDDVMSASGGLNPLAHLMMLLSQPVDIPGSISPVNKKIISCDREGLTRLGVYNIWFNLHSFHLRSSRLNEEWKR